MKFNEALLRLSYKSSGFLHEYQIDRHLFILQMDYYQELYLCIEYIMYLVSYDFFYKSFTNASYLFFDNSLMIN